MGVDESPSQTQLSNRPFELPSGGGRILQRKGRKTREPGGVFRNDRCKEVIDDFGLAHGHHGVSFSLNPWRIEGKNFQIESPGIHIRQSLLREVEQAAGRFSPCGGLGDRSRARTVIDQVWRHEVFFERHLVHVSSLNNSLLCSEITHGQSLLSVCQIRESGIPPALVSRSRRVATNPTGTDSWFRALTPG